MPKFGEDSIRCVRILAKAQVLYCNTRANPCHIDSHLLPKKAVRVARNLHHTGTRTSNVLLGKCDCQEASTQEWYIYTGIPGIPGIPGMYLVS